MPTDSLLSENNYGAFSADEQILSRHTSLGHIENYAKKIRFYKWQGYENQALKMPSIKQLEYNYSGLNFLVHLYDFYRF